MRSPPNRQPTKLPNAIKIRNKKYNNKENKVFRRYNLWRTSGARSQNLKKNLRARRLVLTPVPWFGTIGAAVAGGTATTNF